MRRQATAHVLLVFVALLAGVLPLRRCLPTDSCDGGIVVLGMHVVHDHESGGPEGEGGPSSEDASCVDTPIDGRLPAVATAFAAPAIAPTGLAVEVGPLGSSGADAASAPVPDDSVPRGTRTVVLLR